MHNAFLWEIVGVPQLGEFAETGSWVIDFSSRFWGSWSSWRAEEMAAVATHACPGCGKHGEAETEREPLIFPGARGEISLATPTHCGGSGSAGKKPGNAPVVGNGCERIRVVTTANFFGESVSHCWRELE